MARFLDPRQHPSISTEKREYDLHQNHSSDPGYRRFLDAIFKPLNRRLPPASSGLDYGCGPGPALVDMFREVGHEMSAYDPIYESDPQALDRRYDFVTCTEAAEHFHNPAKEFTTLNRLLKSGGHLGILTLFQNDDECFAEWHYRRDPTHVIFYREDTMAWIADQLGWTFDLTPPRLAIFQKP